MVSRRVPRILWLLLGVALAVRLVAIVIDTTAGILVQPAIASYYDGYAAALSSAWLDGQFLVPFRELYPAADPARTSPMRRLVPTLLAPFYILLAPLGSPPLAGRLAIAVFSLGLGPLTYAVAREVALPQRAALTASALVLFWPGMIYRSIVIQREIPVVLVTLAMVLVCLRWARATGGIRIVEATAFAVATPLLWVLRPENLLIIAFVALVAFAVRYHERIAALAAAGVTVAIGVVGLAVIGLGRFVGGGVGFSPAAINEFARARAYGGSAYLTWVHYHSWLDIIMLAPLKVVYLLGSPMPWRVNSMADLLAGMSGWLLLALTALAIYGVVAVSRGRSVANWRAVAPLVAFLIIGVVAYAIIEMNGGAAFRRRVLFTPALAVLAIVGLRGHWFRSAAATHSPLATEHARRTSR